VKKGKRGQVITYIQLELVEHGGCDILVIFCVADRRRTCGSFCNKREQPRFTEIRCLPPNNAKLKDERDF